MIVAFSQVLVGNLFCTALAGIIVLLKKLLGNRLSLRFHYRIWIPLFVSMAMVFVPVSRLHLFQYNALFAQSGLAQQAQAAGGTMDVAEGYRWTNDIAEAVTLADHSGWMHMLQIVWCGGALLLFLIYCGQAFRLKQIRRAARAASDRETRLLHTCKETCGVRQTVLLLQSDAIHAPCCFGVRTCCLFLPIAAIHQLTEQELTHIFLHELMHIRHKDAVTNYILCLAQILYWCNPFLWVILAQIRRDREAYCDWDVLRLYAGQEERLCYGSTLLRFARLYQRRHLYAANDLCGGKSQMRYRIEQIASFHPANRKMAVRGGGILLLICMLLAMQLPVTAAVAADTQLYTPEPSMHITAVDYHDIFGDNTGSVVIYNEQADQYMVYHLEQAQQRIAPCSTFKIFSALHALEQGIITPEQSMLPWDGTQYAYPEWNENQDLYSAMQLSVNWYFEQLDTASGADELAAFYQKIGY
ncbi:MAG: M56 family metallopeptidase, partial [Eubacteriales bacterium]|nr:M56 family metallopeptidase [Eubacteriales bacterium]